MPQERMTLEQYRKEQGLGPVIPATGTKKAPLNEYGFMSESKNDPGAKQRPSKYGAKKTKVDGICFDSMAESEYYGRLKYELIVGKIMGFCRQPEFVLQDGDGTVIRYRADFIVWRPDGSAEVVDVKGVETPEFKLKEKLFRARFPKIRLEVVK